VRPSINCSSLFEREQNAQSDDDDVNDDDDDDDAWPGGVFGVRRLFCTVESDIIN